MLRRVGSESVQPSAPWGGGVLNRSATPIERTSRMPYQRSLLARWGAISAAVVAASACLALASSAQAASTLPTLSLAATASSITVSGSAQSGAVKVVASVTGVKGETTILLFMLKPGVTVAEAEAGQKSSGKDPNRL